MMAVPNSPLFSMLFSLMISIALVSFNPLLLAFVAVSAGTAAGVIFAIKGRYLPRWIMDVLERLSDRTSLERAYESRGRQELVIDAAQFAANLKSRVVGQDQAIDEIAIQLRRRLATKRTAKPLAVFCFAGPPGVGKTHLAKTLAELLFSKKENLHFFDMSQFGQPHAASSLFGAARGYVGSSSYGSLTSALRDTPNAVVLLDEFEKAHPDVHKRFLTAWNDGFITETSDGARIPTNEAIFILTTNAASRRVGEIAAAHSEDLEECSRLIKNALIDAQFAPEVLSRIDEVFAFRSLKGLDVARVVALEIEALANQFGLKIAGGGISPSILLSAVETLEKRMDGGVRDISRAIERDVTDGLIEARAKNASTVRIIDHNGVNVVWDESASTIGRYSQEQSSN